MQSEQLLHDTHYLRYWALDTRAHDLLEKAKEESFVNNLVNAYTCYNNALEVLLEMERLLLLVLPEYHHEKVIHYDKLAQTCVALGNTHKAKEYFALSYQHSCMVSGAETPPTLAIRQLMLDPPSSTKELYRRYQTRT